jgi:hypothetical protein
LALGITRVTVLQYRVKDGERTESYLFQEVSTADLEARLDARLGLNEPQFRVRKSQNFGIFGGKRFDRMNCKERSQRFAIGSFHAFCSGCLKNKLTCTDLWGYFFMGKERTVGRGGKEIDVWYDDIFDS